MQGLLTDLRRIFDYSVVACTCNPATLEAEFRNGVGLVLVVGLGGDGG